MRRKQVLGKIVNEGSSNLRVEYERFFCESEIEKFACTMATDSPVGRREAILGLRRSNASINGPAYATSLFFGLVNVLMLTSSISQAVRTCDAPMRHRKSGHL